MGDPLYPLERKDILKTNTILSRTAFFFLLILWLGGVFIEMAITWF